MVIDACETEILERTGSKGFDELFAGGVDVDRAARDLLEKIVELFV